MSRTAKKTNRKRILIRILLFILVAFLVVLFARHLILKAVLQGSKTVLPEVLVFEDDYPLKSTVIMKEDVAKAGGNGVLTMNVAEGIRIPAGTEIANINLMADKTGSREQLLKVQSAIDYKTQKEAPVDGEEYAVTENERQLVENIQQSIANKNYYNVTMSMTSLDLMTRRAVDVSELGNLLDKSIEELEALKAELEQDINTSSLRYFSQNGGLVSFEVDGYEELLPARDFENYDYNYLDNVQAQEVEQADQQVSEGDVIYKLIDNFEWFLGIQITNTDEWQQYEEGQKLAFKVNDLTLRGRIVMLKVEESRGVAIIRFDEGLEKLYADRFPEVYLVKQKVRAYKFPESALVTNEAGQQGVYVKEINGIVKFRPILLLKTEEEFAYANMGDDNGYISIGGEAEGEEPVVEKTITMYDEIMINPSVVKEGQVLD